jgi:hypothetical protein
MRLLAQARRRVYLIRSGFTQLWHAVQGIDMGFGNHTDFVTIGSAIGTPECEVPTCGLSIATGNQLCSNVTGANGLSTGGSRP